MPIFEYECRNCGYAEEQLEFIPGNRYQCPRCLMWMHRIMSAPSFKINGASEANGYTIQGKDCNE